MTTAPRVVASVDPALGARIAVFPVATPVEVAAAVDRAREASQWWRDLGFAGRARRLDAWRSALWRRADELADLLHRENGKTLDDAHLEIILTVEHLRWATHHAERALAGRKVAPGLLFANYTARVEHEPLGVVGVISPWNYPLYSPNSGVAYALAAGNTVVLKPSEHTPTIAVRYVEAFAEANPDAPAGVLQAVVGDGRTGAALCAAGVDKIAFTGSTATGRRILEACAATMTPVSLECGGKDPVIVAADADLRAAARAVAWGALTNAGQTCVGVERAYVVREVAAEFEALLVGEARGVRSGSDAAASYGPMTMAAQVDVVRRHVTDALAAGGRALVGGLGSIGERFIEPIIIVDAPEDCSAVREETFGPTLTLRVVDDVDEAVRLANDHDYALSASVFSRHHASEIAARLRAGQVSLNSVIAFAGMGSVPMGGVGASGFGRAHGDEGLLEFTRTRSTVAQRFSLPGVEVVDLHRAASLVPLMRRVLDLRHR